MGIIRTLAAHPMAISDDERAFFIELGQRIAQRRKDLDITQAQLAELLGVSQQAMNSFEKGRRRVPVSALPAIARAVGASLLEELADGGHDLAPATGLGAHLRPGHGDGDDDRRAHPVCGTHLRYPRTYIFGRLTPCRPTPPRAD